MPLPRRKKLGKGTMSSAELAQAKRLAERMKGKKNIDNPHALARHLVQQKFTKAQRIDIVNTIIKGTQKQVGEKVRQASRTARRVAGRVAGRVAQRAGGAVESAYRRGKAARIRRQVIRQPAKHGKEAIRQVGRAISPSPFKTPQERAAHLGEAGRSAAQAVGSIAPARRAARMHREAKTQVNIFGRSRTKRPYGQTPKKVQKDGDIASVRENIPTPVGGNPPTPTPFEDLTTVLQQTIDLAAQVKQKRNRNADEDVKEYYNKILKQLRSISEELLSGLSMELDEAKSEYNKESDE